MGSSQVLPKLETSACYLIIMIENDSKTPTYWLLPPARQGDSCHSDLATSSEDLVICPQAYSLCRDGLEPRTDPHSSSSSASPPPCLMVSRCYPWPRGHLTAQKRAITVAHELEIGKSSPELLRGSSCKPNIETWGPGTGPQREAKHPCSPDCDVLVQSGN